ncbi:hypothetical protein FACS189472_12200 [Alphaproteobacteria bacterium]|nr:hypothetical protein FACS189472_12200 [Alphaproteobacteria bacterium]
MKPGNVIEVSSELQAKMEGKNKKNTHNTYTVIIHHIARTQAEKNNTYMIDK